MRRLLVTLAALGVLAGCGTATVPADAPASPPTTAVVVEAPAPVGLEIPKIGVKTTEPLMPLALDAEMELEVPPLNRPELAGWFKSGVRPGEVGPAVIAGHVNGDGRPGIFARLHELGPGDEVFVDREDGSRVRFTVTRVVSYPKDAYPTAEVYGDVPTPQLRLVTCAGDFDEAADSYRENLVAYAELAT